MRLRLLLARERMSAVAESIISEFEGILGSLEQGAGRKCEHFRNDVPCIWAWRKSVRAW